jgi:sporulation protein YlmC with PRC-barrel domain
MNNFHSIAMLSVLNLVLSAPAFAANVEEKRQELQEQQQDVQEKRQELRQEQRERRAEATKNLQQMHKASKVVGADVKNREGEKLGKIEELVLDLPLGEIAYAVISGGGVGGAGEQLHAIPWPALDLSDNMDYFILDIDQETWKKAPGFDKNSWPGLNDRQWLSDVYRYYKAKPYWQ